MNVIVPFTDLKMETYRAVVREAPEAHFVYTGNSPDDYWRLIESWWRGKDDLVIVEHDVVPPEGWAMSFALCLQDWCAYAYRMGDIVATALGATKFGMGLQQRYEGLVSNVPVRYRHWDGLDAQVIGYLHMAGEREHVHEGQAEHLREPWKLRRSNVVRLRYIGNGAYLNGVPAADHEPATEQAAAEALASGLYEVIEEPKRKGKIATVAAADDVPSPVDEVEAPAEA